MQLQKVTNNGRTNSTKVGKHSHVVSNVKFIATSQSKTLQRRWLAAENSWYITTLVHTEPAVDTRHTSTEIHYLRHIETRKETKSRLAEGVEEPAVSAADAKAYCEHQRSRLIIVCLSVSVYTLAANERSVLDCLLPRGLTVHVDCDEIRVTVILTS